jgi:hypothetical protein
VSFSVPSPALVKPLLEPESIELIVAETPESVVMVHGLALNVIGLPLSV